MYNVSGSRCVYFSGLVMYVRDGYKYSEMKETGKREGRQGLTVFINFEVIGRQQSKAYANNQL